MNYLKNQLLQMKFNQSTYNVTANIPLPSGYYNKDTARAAVPTLLRKRGLILLYETADGVWVSEMFKGILLSNWAVDSKWKSISEQGINDFFGKVVSSNLYDASSFTDVANNIYLAATGTVATATLTGAKKTGFIPVTAGTTYTLYFNKYPTQDAVLPPGVYVYNSVPIFKFASWNGTSYVYYSNGDIVNTVSNGEVPNVVYSESNNVAIFTVPTGCSHIAAGIYDYNNYYATMDIFRSNIMLHTGAMRKPFELYGIDKVSPDRVYRLQGKTAIYNVTENHPMNSGTYYTPAAARSAVPADIRKLGMMIVYRTGLDSWVLEQYVGSLISGWENGADWKGNRDISMARNHSIMTHNYNSKAIGVPVLADDYQSLNLPMVRKDNAPSMCTGGRKRGGVVFRTDDTNDQKLINMLRFTRVLDKYGYKLSLAVNISQCTTQESIDILRDIVDRGHELTDHTPNHRTDYAVMATDELYSFMVGKRGVVLTDAPTRKVYFEWEDPPRDGTTQRVGDISVSAGSPHVTVDFSSNNAVYRSLVYTTEFGWVRVKNFSATGFDAMHRYTEAPLVFQTTRTETQYAAETGKYYISRNGLHAMMLASSIMFKYYGLPSPKFMLQPGMSMAVVNAEYMYDEGPKLGYYGASSWNPTQSAGITMYALTSFVQRSPYARYRLPYWTMDSERRTADQNIVTVLNNSAKHIHTVDIFHYFYAYIYLWTTVPNASFTNAPSDVVMPVPAVPSLSFPGCTAAEWAGYTNEQRDPKWNGLTDDQRKEIQLNRYEREMDKFCNYLRKYNIPVYNHSELISTAFNNLPDASTNIMPVLYNDRAGQGRPEGYNALEVGTTWVNNSGVSDDRGYSLYREANGVFFTVEPLCGLEEGRNKFSFYAKGLVSTTLTLTLTGISRVYMTGGVWDIVLSGDVATSSIVMGDSGMSSAYVKYEMYIDVPYQYDDFQLKVSLSFPAGTKSMNISGMYFGKAY